jgi:molecular chaperone DnaJ
VCLNVWVPKNLSKEEKKTLEELQKHDNFKPNPTKQERGFFDKMKEMFN